MVLEATIAAIIPARLQSNRHHQQTNTQFFLQAGCPSCRPTNSVKALKGKVSRSTDVLTTSSPGSDPTLYLTAKGTLLRWWRVAEPLVISYSDNLRDPDVTMDNFKRLLKTFLFSAYQCN